MIQDHEIFIFKKIYQSIYKHKIIKIYSSMSIYILYECLFKAHLIYKY